MRILEAVTRRADVALFEAKRNGRDRIVMHTVDGTHPSPAPGDASRHGDVERALRDVVADAAR